MKRTLAMIVLAALCALLGACAGTQTEENQETQAGLLRTGLCLQASLNGSADAAEEEAGSAQIGWTITAVLLDENGVIQDCTIDQAQLSVALNAQGLFAAQPPEQVLTKRELGAEYGMAQVSSIGKEWFEQADAFAQYCRGKTVEQVRSGAIGPAATPPDAQLVASVTMDLGDFVAGLEQAAASAQYLGAMKGDVLRVGCAAEPETAEALEQGEGKVGANLTAAAVSMRGDAISSCVVDALQAEVRFSAQGKISGDPAAVLQSRNVIGAEYGMAQASSIGKEWFEQATAFAGYVTGKTAPQVEGIAMSQSGTAETADLVASCTIRIGDFKTAVLRAAQAE